MKDYISLIQVCNHSSIIRPIDTKVVDKWTEWSERSRYVVKPCDNEDYFFVDNKFLTKMKRYFIVIDKYYKF